MNSLRQSDYKIPEIEQNIPLDFHKKFDYQIDNKIPFMLVGYDGTLNLKEAQKTLRKEPHEKS